MSPWGPQTPLPDRTNGEPPPRDRGGPLRAVSSVRYGNKNIKWLGRVRFGDGRPKDSWAGQG